MDKIEWIAPCHFGLESVLKREVEQLGYEIVQVEDGGVTFRGGAEAVCRANIFLRTAERVLMKVGRRLWWKDCGANTGSSGLKKQARLTRCACFL